MFVQNGFPEERIQVLSHGLETAGLEPGGRNMAEKPKVLFIGNLVEGRVDLIWKLRRKQKQLPQEQRQQEQKATRHELHQS